ncbi:tetraspanin-8 [Cornus florida]|uniref:tetraspanin-8 n=1 Tax=Cornus florida TaxID=4283 RepID=UPI00289B43EE|nr:tetraspanin-8 [Cornus florida]
MVRVSNALISIFNVLTLLLSVVAVGGSVWFYLNPGTVCQKAFLQQPLLIAGLVLLGVSLLGLAGSCWKVSWMLYVYLFVMFVAILALAGVTVFGILVTNKGVGQVISGRGFEEYRLGDYSNWLQKHVVNDKNWYKIKSCMVDAKICESLLGKGRVGATAAADFYKAQLSATQAGCCKPPTSCGFEFQNATFWAVPKSGPAVSDSDCKTWSNNEGLCFDCKSCKAGFLANIKKEWRLLAIIGACVVVFLIIVYTLGCCALKNTKEDNYRSRRYKSYA